MKKIQFFLIFLIFSSSFQYKGVDLLEYEGDVDWSRLSPNIDFAILRANWKIGIDENQFENNYAGAKNYGVSVGAYWYSYAHNEEEAAKEAKDCLDIIKGKQFEYPIFYYIMKQETFDTGLKLVIIVAFIVLYLIILIILIKIFLINTLFGLLIGTQMNQRYLIRFGNMVLNI